MNRPTISEYTIPEPEIPTATWALIAGVVVGLIALFLAALAAFTKVTEHQLDAVFKAAVVEVSMIVEALALARSRRWRDYVLPTLGVIISLWVSGVYNYVQAAAIGAANGVSEPWQLWPLALGPLAAVAMLSLNLGHALREHEHAVTVWQKDRQQWLDDATTKWDAAQRAAQAQREAEERAAQERQAQADREAAERAAQRAAAIERARIRAEHPRPTTDSTSGISQRTDEIPPATEPTTGSTTRRFGSKAEFLQFMVEANGTAPKNAEELKALGVPHTTAYRWWRAWDAQKTATPNPN